MFLPDPITRSCIYNVVNLRSSNVWMFLRPTHHFCMLIDAWFDFHLTLLIWIRPKSNYTSLKFEYSPDQTSSTCRTWRNTELLRIFLSPHPDSSTPNTTILVISLLVKKQLDVSHVREIPTSFPVEFPFRIS